MNVSEMRPCRKIAILQSNYIPWKGYFDIIAAVDEFVLFDEVQFTRRDWRNRNKIIVNGSATWLSIPVRSKGQFDAPIDEIAISDPGWAEQHWRSIHHAYRKAPYFPLYGPLLQTLFEQAAQLPLLSEVNELFLSNIAGWLELTTTFVRSRQVARHADDPTGRLVEICVGRGASLYLSGPAAKAYIRNEVFESAGVALRYADYAGYPVYDQKAASFEHGVSIIDGLMQCGPSARTHLKSVQAKDGLFARE